MKKKLKPIAIAFADMHLRSDVPVCRSDDFLSVQLAVLEEIVNLGNELAVPVVVAGDLFHKAKAGEALLCPVIGVLKKATTPWVVIAGQHDLPSHSLGRVEESSLGVLRAAGLLHLLDGEVWRDEKTGVTVTGTSYGSPLPIPPAPVDVLLVHELVWSKKAPFPGAPVQGNVERFLRRGLPATSFVITGDNHIPFHVLQDHPDPTLINCGSVTRQAADASDRSCAVYILYPDNTFARYKTDTTAGVISDEHLKKAREMEERFTTFVECLKENQEVGLSFEDNLRRHFATNTAQPGVEQLVWKWVGK